MVAAVREIASAALDVDAVRRRQALGEAGGKQQ
jgi:hypothetical protein